MTETAAPVILKVNRSLVGAIAVVLLTAAGILWYFAGHQNIWAGACLKVGLVMFAFWLALPTISRNGNWGQISPNGLIGIVLLAVLLIGKRVDTRIVVPLLAGAFIATMVLRPRSRSK